MPKSKGGDVDAAKPLLTYSRPKGEYKGADSDPIMIDFWLSNAKLKGDGGDIACVTSLTMTIRDSLRSGNRSGYQGGWVASTRFGLELLDKSDMPVDNGGYNTTTREITVVK